MKIVQINPPDRVIVRSWGDEPVLLFAYRADLAGHTVFVGGPEAARPIGLPSEHVFVFNDETLRALLDAYLGQNKVLLQHLYASCNRYRNHVDSSHDQERLAHPDRAAEGDRQ
jgi:hypothetical protein